MAHSPRGTQKKLSEEKGVSPSTISRHVNSGKINSNDITRAQQAVTAPKEVSESLKKMNGEK